MFSIPGPAITDPDQPSTPPPTASAPSANTSAAALYTFAAERNRPVVCFAYVTNEMGQGDSEFEKGDANGSTAALQVIDAAIRAWKSDAERA